MAVQIVAVRLAPESQRVDEIQELAWRQDHDGKLGATGREFLASWMIEHPKVKVYCRTERGEEAIVSVARSPEGLVLTCQPNPQSVDYLLRLSRYESPTMS
jgi:hypothetical protein